MYRKAVLFLGFLTIFLITSPAGSGAGLSGNQAVPLPPDPLVQFMIDQVDTSRIYQLTGDLSGEWPVTVASSTAPASGT